MTPFPNPLPEVRAALEESRAHLNRILDQVGDRWATQVYSDGAQWNVGQIVTHLAISEGGMFKTAQGIAAGSEGVPADFDIDRYNRRSVEKRADTPPESAREELAAIRAELLAWAGTLTDEQWAAKGRHATLNVYSVRQFLKIMAIHEKQHADDIAAALGIT
ncbi:MAG: DinB family protein [bacterium]|nr:DinB family protein [bacterium]